MKLLTVTHFYEDHGGGIERVAARLNREFIASGHEATWAASDADPSPGGGVIAVPLRCANPTEALTGLPMPLPGWRAIGALRRAVRAADAVIIHDALYVTSIAAMLLAKRARKPVVLVQHIAGIAFAGWTMRTLMRLANLIVTQPMLRAADRLVFISDTVRRELLGDPSQVDSSLLFNGVDASIFHPSNGNDRAGIRAAHGFSGEAPLAIFVGRFVAKKGLGILREIAEARPDMQIALAGDGPIRPESWNLPNVHVLGPQPPVAIAELYRAANLLLLPSVGEGYPLVIQEAMASGLPVVCGAESARADPSAAAWLRGVAIDLGDPAGSAARCLATIDDLSASPVDTVAMSAYAIERYSWPAMAAALIEPLDPATSRAQLR